ncbi:MAG TPA: helix-turn-helix transcriptional regulator [Tepidisphaeraceae bacterium]|jgi:DNA-binding CsgD family transcriptional regulator|nr:helix-turn-helix transcriptional regulator [Tepidisphaeraceae bacterium]
MPQSQVIRQGDVQGMLRLLGELAELSSPTERFEHLTEGLCRLVGARVGIFGSFVDAMPGQTRKARRILSKGIEESDRRKLMQYFADGGPPDPSSNALYNSIGTVVTIHDEQMASDETWHGSNLFQDVRKPLGVDHHLYSMHRLNGDRHAFSIGLHRNTGGRPFNERERKIVHLVHSEIGWIYRAAGQSEFLGAYLPPRLLQILRRLLSGMSEKQIAKELKLTPYTVHDHVKRLYRQMGVTSRGELLARFIHLPPQRPDEFLAECQ